MKDPADRHTRDLLDAPSSPGARRQASYAQRQRDAGRRQRTFWLTDDEAESVRQLIEKLREY